MRRKFLAVSVILLLIISFSSCNEQNTTDIPPTDRLPTISIVAMKVGTSNFDGELIAQALDAYTCIH